MLVLRACPWGFGFGGLRRLFLRELIKAFDDPVDPGIFGIDRICRTSEPWYPSGEGRGGSGRPVAFCSDHLDEVFDPELGEGEDFDLGGAVNPDDAVFGLHADGEIMEPIDGL